MTTVRIPVEGEPSFVSSVGVNGIQFLAHTRIGKGGAVALVRVILAEDGTLADVSSGETSRTKLRAEFDELARRARVRVGPASGAYVAWRIHQAAAAHRVAGKTLSAGAEAALAKVPAVQGPLEHPARALSGAPDAERRLAASVDLHGEPEFQFLVPPTRAVTAVADYVDAHGPSDADDPEGEATRAAFYAGIDAFHTPAERARLATQLRDAALVFAGTRRPHSALDAVAVADALEDTRPTALPPHEIPFVMAMYYKFMMVRREMQKQG